jgi:N-sulfoglucosamine sulfohydrolase
VNGKPNIIYLNAHDTGRILQPYGQRVRTPNLQALAEGGVLFRQAFSAAPTCSPSRAALLFGMVPHCTGMVGLGNRGVYPFELDRHVAHTLKRSGYETVTWGIVDNHLGLANIGKDVADIGYERSLGDRGLSKVVDFLREGHDRPFFLSLSYFLAHRLGRGFSSPHNEYYDPRFLALPATLPDTPEVREDWTLQLSDIEAYDDRVGRIWRALEDAGLAESTLIIATTDHGVAFPGMKCNLTKHGTGVHLIMRGPGGFSGGKVIDGMVCHIDLFPTLCEVIGIERPEWLQGESLMPLLRGEVSQIHDQIIAEVSYHAAYEPMRCVRTPRWVYIRRFGSRRRPVLANCDASLSKDAWLAEGYAERQLPDEMLFDTFYDPEEMNDLAAYPAHAEVLEGMRDRLRKWMEQTDDPLLKGRVPLPETGWVNPQDAVDPDQFGNRAAVEED